MKQGLSKSSSPSANPSTVSIAHLGSRASERASFFTGGVDLTNYRTNARRHLRPARSNAIRPLPPLSAPSLSVCLKVGQGIVNIRSCVPGHRSLPRSRPLPTSLICTTDSSHLLMDGARVGRSSERFGYHSPISARKAPARASERSGRKTGPRREGKLTSNARPSSSASVPPILPAADIGQIHQRRTNFIGC